MAVGERIRYFRRKRALTQKALGILAGYPEKSADIRVAQYENGSRHPKADVIEDLAEIFAVSPKALSVPNIDDTSGLMHTLFALEDLYGLHAATDRGEVFLFVDDAANQDAAKLHAALLDWGEQFRRLITGRTSRAEYDQWRYNYPEKVMARRAKTVKVKQVILRGK